MTLRNVMKNRGNSKSGRQDLAPCIPHNRLHFCVKVKLFATNIMVILYNLRFYVHDLNGSVMARVRWEHKTRAVVFACGVFAEKSKWDSDQQKAKKGTVHSVNGHSCSARDINSAISEMNEVISEAFNEFGRAGTSLENPHQTDPLIPRVVDPR